jgi:multidrug transporter EmrE-like cation transporter
MPFWTIIFILVSGLSLAGGDILLRKWVAAPHYLFYILGFCAYFVGLNFLAQSFKHEQLVIAVAASIIVNILVVLAANYFIFHEALTVRHFVGVGLAIATIAVLW